MSADQIISQSTIEYIKFSLNGDAENNKNGIINIRGHGLFEPDGSPIPHNLYDKGMGSIEHNNICPICQHGKKLCPGHRGKHILKYPVMQPLGISQIRKLLKIFCFHCGSLMINMDKIMNAPIHKRLNIAVLSSTEGKACPVCKTIHPKIVKTNDDNFTIYAEYNVETTIKKNKSSNTTGDKLYPAVIKNIFEKISDEMISILNINDPKKLIFNVLEISPNCVRPSTKNFSNMSSTHDFTTIYQHIIKRNNEQIPEQLPDAVYKYTPGAVIPQNIDIILQNEQQFVYDLVIGTSSASISNGTTGKRSIMIGSRPPKSVMRSINGKEGLIRGALLGKRVQFISRSTISGNTNYKIDEVGIPLEFAKIQQVKETVMPYNREFLIGIYLNGRKQYPGCTHIIKKSTGEMHDVSGLNNKYLPEIGDIICRNLIDGDYVYINRQPTLGYSSIGVHRAKIILNPEKHTLELNVLSCNFYNADFDGDQMNLINPHEPATIAEAIVMSHVSNTFISIQTGNPISGQVQDSTIGCYELTRHFTKIDKYRAIRLFTKVEDTMPNFDKYANDHIFTGIDIINLLLESNNIRINYSGTPKTYDELFIKYIPFHKEEKKTIIKDGVMLTGVLDKKSIGEKQNGGLYHIISREYGVHKTFDIIYKFQQVVLYFLYNRGITISTSDLFIQNEGLDQIHNLCNDVRVESELITNKLIEGNIICPINTNLYSFYEKMQLNVLKLDDSEILKILLSNINPDKNGLFKMISVGSKGNIANMKHIMASIGQITINGERIKENFCYGRTLPYFTKFSFDYKAGGFINNNYISGLTVSEFVFGAMYGRFDIINKALSTASTGYMTRKGVISNESSITNNHMHVVKENKIIQLIYGEDGLDSRQLENVTFRNITLNDAELLEKCIPGSFDKNYKDIFNILKKDRDDIRHKIIKMQNTSNNAYFIKDTYLLPINVNRLIQNMLGESTLDNLEGKIDRILDLCDKLAYVFLNDIQEKKKAYIPKYKKYAAYFMCISIRAELHPKNLSMLTNDQISYIIDFIRYRYSLALIGYGVAVGIIAAQSVSEPLTQYMLDSHHRSVSGGTNKSGLNRVMEICGAKPISKEQSPSMQLLIKKKYATDINSAQLIANIIEYVVFRVVVKRYDVIYESDVELIYPPYKDDNIWMQEHIDAHPLIKKSPNLSKPCYRFVIDKSVIILKSINLELIIKQLQYKYPGIYILNTSEAVEEIIIRIWNTNLHVGKADFLEQLLDCPIRGVKGILKADAKVVNRHIIAENGEFITESRFIIETIGTNLSEVFLYSAIDPLNSFSSSIGETNQMFGIESARDKIINELIICTQSSSDNLRHICMYADVMTSTGKFTNLEKGGISFREHNNILLRAAMSAPIQVLQNAAISETVSKVGGIAGEMLLGALPKIGTMYNSLIINEEEVSNEASIDSILDDL